MMCVEMRLRSESSPVLEAQTRITESQIVRTADSRLNLAPLDGQPFDGGDIGTDQGCTLSAYKDSFNRARVDKQFHLNRCLSIG